MWSLLFCISSTSIFCACMAARTACQRRCSSAVEIGVLRRSLSAGMGGPFVGCGANKYGRGDRVNCRVCHCEAPAGRRSNLVVTARDCFGMLRMPRNDGEILNRALRARIGVEIPPIARHRHISRPDDEIAEALIRLPLARIG